MQNIKWHTQSITHAQRCAQKQQTPCIIWLTGLSGSGKSTIANALEVKLFDQNKHSYLLDGDNIRYGLNRDLNFNDKDRIENIRRLGEVSKLMVDAGLIVITAFISPFKKDREMVRSMFNKDQFIEVFIDTPLEVCEMRDPKNLYKKARAGEIKNFTGIDSEYEAPPNPQIRIDTTKKTIEEAVNAIIEHINVRL